MKEYNEAYVNRQQWKIQTTVRVLTVISIILLTLGVVLAFCFANAYPEVDADYLAEALENPYRHPIENAPVGPNLLLGVTVAGVFSFFSVVVFGIRTVIVAQSSLGLRSQAELMQSVSDSARSLAEIKTELSALHTNIQHDAAERPATSEESE